MKTIYLHIGTFKTGTSSIQKYLKENISWFKEHGILIPDTQLIAHHPLPLSLIRDYSEFRAAWPAFEGDSTAIWQATFDEIASSPLNSVIISSETFCDLVNEHARDAKDDFKRVLKHYFQDYNVKVICYLRPLIAYSVSMYKEAIKAGGITNLYSEEISNFLQMRSIHLFPSQYLDFYSELFGKENLIIKKYDRNTLINKNILDDFLDIFKLTPRAATDEESNLSIPDHCVDLVRTLNFAQLNDEAFNKELSRQLIEATKRENPGSLLLHELQTQIAAESQTLLEGYGIQLETSGTIPQLHNQQHEENQFLILLLGNLLQQNRRLESRLKSIESMLTKLIGADPS